jgi:hypothetical protein
MSESNLETTAYSLSLTPSSSSSLVRFFDHGGSSILALGDPGVCFL